MSTSALKGRPVFIVDDEADATNLNTKVNQKDFSAINRHIKAIRNDGSSCIYLQVTATPQAVLLQKKIGVQTG